MVSETNPVEVLLVQSQRLEAFADFWRRRIDIEKEYLDDLSELRIPDPLGDGQLQALAKRTRELLLDELEERRRGFAKLTAAYKTLKDKFWTKEGPSYLDRWGGAMEPSIMRINSLAAEIATAESIAERLAIKGREENFPMSSLVEKEDPLQPNVLSRFLAKVRNEQPKMHDDTQGFLSADSAYRQKVHKINTEKYIIQNEFVPQTVLYAEHDRECIVALRDIVSTFSAVHSDLAQVLNVTSSQLHNVSSSVDASTETASFAERLDEGFTSLIQPCRYTSYDISSSFRPTTILFCCPLPDDLDGASPGELAVANAFEAILNSAVHKYPRSLYQAICNAHNNQDDDMKLSALQLESLWDPSQPDGGLGAVDHLENAHSAGLLVYFLTHLPEPFLPLYDSDIKRLKEVGNYEMIGVIAKAGNRMGIARRCNLARLFFKLRHHQRDLQQLMPSRPEGVQIITRIQGLLPQSRLARWFAWVIQEFHWVIETPVVANRMVLPHRFIKEFWDAGFLTSPLS